MLRYEVYCSKCRRVIAARLPGAGFMIERLPEECPRCSTRLRFQIAQRGNAKAGDAVTA